MAERNQYDVFISYSRKDYVDEQKNVIPGNEVSKIKEALTEAGITYWFDEEGIYSGENFTEKIVANIELSRVFVYLSTAHANNSPWTSKEIACADEFGKLIIPVRIDKTPYNKRVIFRIADLSYIDYADNPERGRQELVRSIKAYLEEEKAAVARKAAEELNRQEELERQRRQQEEEKLRQERISKLEMEIAAKESRLTEFQKIVLKRELELREAKVDVEACERELQRLQKTLEELREPKEIAEKRRKAEEDAKKRTEEEAKHKAEEERQKKLKELENLELKPVEKNGKYGFADDSGKVMIPCQWNYAVTFTEGLARVRDEHMRWGFINKKGEVVIPCKWKNAFPFSEGLAAVLDFNEKWGFVDKSGRLVIPCKWDYVTSFSDSFAKAKDASTWKRIDKTGAVVGFAFLS